MCENIQSSEDSMSTKKREQQKKRELLNHNMRPPSYTKRVFQIIIKIYSAVELRQPVHY